MSASALRNSPATAHRTQVVGSGSVVTTGRPQTASHRDDRSQARLTPAQPIVLEPHWQATIESATD